MHILEVIFKNYEIFLLVLIRTSGIFLASPLFSAENIPAMTKIGLSISIAVLLTSVLSIDIDLSNQILFILIFKELLVGLIIGFIAYIFFTAFYVMGQIVDMNIGFGMANVVDPQSRVQVPLSGNFYYIIAFLLLLLIDGHHSIITALKDSYTTIPIGELTYGNKTITIIIDAMVQSFEIGFKLSLPMVAIIFLTDIVLGILARTIPQMNVFVVGMPLKLLVGLLLLYVGFSIFFGGVGNILEFILGYIEAFLNIN